MKQNKIYLEKLNGTKELLDELVGLENVIENDDCFEFTLDNQELIDSDIINRIQSHQSDAKEDLRLEKEKEKLIDYIKNLDAKRASCIANVLVYKNSCVACMEDMLGLYEGDDHYKKVEQAYFEKFKVLYKLK